MMPGTSGRVGGAWSSAVKAAAPLRWRLAAAAGVVALVVLTVLVWGVEDEEVLVPVVVTTEDWGVGTQGEHTVVPVPANLAGLFVRPGDLEGMTAAVRIPSGVVVAPPMLSPVDARPAEVTHWSIQVDASLWPTPGPQPGDLAVFSKIAGGCAEVVLPIVLAEGSDAVTIAVDQETAPLFATTEGELVVWPAPPGGVWPLCERTVS